MSSDLFLRKSRFQSRFVLALGGTLFCAALQAQPPRPLPENAAPVAVRTLLDQGVASGSLPDGLVIRLNACMGASDGDAAGGRVPDTLEAWEFTANQVHRVDPASRDGERVYPRVESRPFDSKRLCKELLEGKAIEIETRKGKGPETALMGTRYHTGSRFIEVVWKGKTILELHESNTAFSDLYRESDARAFGALYERLANQARPLFKTEAEKGAKPVGDSARPARKD